MMLEGLSEFIEAVTLQSRLYLQRQVDIAGCSRSGLVRKGVAMENATLLIVGGKQAK